MQQRGLPPRFIASLLTKPFLILTGLAGSGKTKLAEAFSNWIAQNSDTQICMVAVGADWTNREPLLGYPNALNSSEYITPDNRALELLIEASKPDNAETPYFLILDEMYMSHVERYFADFLSAMESDSKEIKLHSSTAERLSPDKLPVPPKIKLNGNIFIIGTVNIDETTYMFSPKVLDRAQVIEFRVSESEMKSYLENPAPIDMDKLKGKGATMAASFVAKAKDKTIPLGKHTETLMPFFNKLQEAGAEFGYRTAAEISRFIAICTDLIKDEPDNVEKMKPEDIVDAAIMQKLLPKVHGSRNKIEKILRILASQCIATPSDDPFKNVPSEAIKYRLSYEKIKRMHDRVIKDGFTSYAEA